jgi:hypothetical protein
MVNARADAHSGAGSRTQDEYKSYAEGTPAFFIFLFCDLCETFARSAFGLPFPS